MKTAAVRFGAGRVAGRRMDAPFFLNDAKAYLDGLSRCPYDLTTVGDESQDVFFGNIFSRCFVKDAIHGVPYLRASEIQKADLSGGGLFLANRQAADLEYLRFKKGMILVTCSGTLGKCAYADSRYEEFIGTHDLIRIVPRKSKLLPGVLYAFLAGRFGFAMLTHSQYGSVILHTNPDQVRTIQIPVFPDELQERVNRLVLDSARLREEADAAQKKAIRYFDCYDLPKQPAFFSKKLSRLCFSWTAYNNNLDVDAIRDSFGVEKVKLSQVSRSIFAPPIFKHIYLSKDNGYPFLSGREMTFQNQRFYRWLSPRGVRNIEEYVIHKGMLLIYVFGTTDGGMIGDVRIADENIDGVCLSNLVVRLVPDDFRTSCWIYAFLKSNAGRRLIQSLAKGSTIQFISTEHIFDVEIPKPNDDSDKIESWIEEYIDKRAKSNNMENEAIDMVEREIESWQEGGE